jgi:hypothetical protein
VGFFFLKKILTALYFLSFFLFLSFCYSCYATSVRVGLKGILRVMPLSTSFAFEVWIELKGLATVMPLSVSCLAGFIGSNNSWCSCQECIGPCHSFLFYWAYCKRKKKCFQTSLSLLFVILLYSIP